MKTPTPMDNIHAAYGDKGTTIAAAVVHLLLQDRIISKQVKEDLAGDPMLGLLSKLLTDKMAMHTSKIVSDLVAGLFEKEETGGFIAACIQEAKNREAANEKLKEVLL